MCNESYEIRKTSGPSQAAIKLFNDGEDKFLKSLAIIF